MQTIPFPGNTPYPRSVSLWQPAGAPRALVLLSHGMAEHIARYDHVGAALAGRGYLVAGYNHLGHGAEAPRLGWFAERDGWSRLVEDLKTVMDSLATPGLPRVLLGHSMGSFLAREYALRYPDGLDALVLSGTGWHPRLLCVAGLLPAKTLCFLGQGHKPSALLDRLAFSANNKPFASAGGTACDWLSRDARQVQAYLADPLCGFVFTASGFADLFVGLLDLSRIVRLKSLPSGLPVLLLSGSCDPVGGMGKGVHAVAGQYRDAGLGKVMTRLYEGARHEVFNETNRQEVLEDLAAWLNRLGSMKGEE